MIAQPNHSEAANSDCIPERPMMAIADIKIGTRHRRDMGNISELAANIAEIGLLQPIVVRPDRMLIAGQRRLRACQSLGRTTIEVTTVDLDKVVAGEYSENVFRKAFTPSEMADIADAIEPLERAAAKERVVAAHASPGKFPELATGNALDKVARIVGADRKTLQKARVVRDAARADPEQCSKFQAEMDKTGRVDGAYKRLNKMRQSAAIRAESPPLPSQGPYRCLVADPPWPFPGPDRDEDPSHRASTAYPTMTRDQICGMGEQVRSIAHDDCVLWLWATNANMPMAIEVLDAWGFEHKTIVTWAKDKMGLGSILRGQTEHCLLAMRGKPVIHLTNQTTLLYGKVRAHSQKPEEFYHLVESLCPAPRYGYLFARNFSRELWDCHGDELPVAANDADDYRGEAI
jgi:N6-adenosine-specific RNA methylase IME4/ParB-like chromosome segregation protein Spo0J